MNRRLFAAASSLLALSSASGAEATSSRPEALVGTWEVDLRPNPTSPPYIQSLVVETVSGNTFRGTFYGAEVSEGRFNADWGTLRIAFVTSDASGPYNHSAVLNGSRLEGLTNSIGRKFLAYWSATKK
jgi:hypothetical protein